MVLDKVMLKAIVFLRKGLISIKEIGVVWSLLHDVMISSSWDMVVVMIIDCVVVHFTISVRVFEEIILNTVLLVGDGLPRVILFVVGLRSVELVSIFMLFLMMETVR